MDLEGSLSSQGPIIRLWPKSDESNPHVDILFPEDQF
jgi:hypothetical protein